MVRRPVIARLREPRVRPRSDVLPGSAAVPRTPSDRHFLLQKVCVAGGRDPTGLATQASVLAIVVVVSCSEQPDLVCVQVVVYDAHGELETESMQLTAQFETVLAVQFEVALEGEAVIDTEVCCVRDCAVIVGPSDG